MPADRPPLIAILNHDPSVINMLATWLETQGMRVVCGNLREYRRGHEDVADFIQRYRPEILLFEVSIPYASNWDYLGALRAIPETSGLPFIVTTNNKIALDKAAGEDTGAIEITGTLADMTTLADAIRSAGTA